MRGEYTTRLWDLPASVELPPRARRIPQRLRESLTTRGTTSACAENTPFCRATSTMMWNYLRVRGEYRDYWPADIKAGELPPRARRIHDFTDSRLTVGGTTSACAENTFRKRLSLYRRWNYLRVRGEYFTPLSGVPCPSELPPRARRIPPPPLPDSTPMGTTSACAENTR